jgi:hypothetical protein
MMRLIHKLESEFLGRDDKLNSASIIRAEKCK